MVDGLHKQNFDLKLELYHRRERQTNLEDQLEALETDKTQTEEMNQTLVGELEKRDKAIEEAVAMIILLEGKLGELTEERDMVRQVEAQGYFGHPRYQLTPNREDDSPRTATLDMSQLDEAPKMLSRQPSFVSDRSERTENLRNVYLGARGSVISLPRVAEGSSDLDTAQASGLASPTLSVLSESSFVSVYGQKGEGRMVPSRVDEPLSLDGEVSKNEAPHVQRAPSTKPDPQHTPRANSFSRGNNVGQFQAIANVTNSSPLQRIERRDPSYSNRRETPRPPSSSKNVGHLDSGKMTKSPSRKASREEKREALRRVMTDAPGGVSLHEPVLPPTPDTVASSTLRRFQNSNDTLDNRCHDGMQGRSQDSLPRVRGSYEKLAHEHLAEQSVVSVDSVAPPPIQDKRRPARQPDSRRQDFQPPPRPRSADESTVSHHHREWNYDSDNSEDSFESSLDIWMRAGAKPSRRGRTSPDLFGFPTSPSKGSWAMHAISGRNPAYPGGAAIDNSGEKLLNLNAAHDVILGRPDGPVAPGPVPAPDRRSSLNAQTGVNRLQENGTPQHTQRPRPRERVHRPRHVRRNSDDAQVRANMKTPAPAQLTQSPPQPQVQAEQKKTNYPPIVGHGGMRAGLSRVFRRSLSGATSKDIPEDLAIAEAANGDSVKDGQPIHTWTNRASTFDDDRAGATPPPILRHHRQGRSGAEPMMDEASSGPALKESALPPPSQQETADAGFPAGAATGTRRKWLPAFSRLSKNS